MRPSGGAWRIQQGIACESPWTACRSDSKAATNYELYRDLDPSDFQPSKAEAFKTESRRNREGGKIYPLNSISSPLKVL